MGLAGSCPSSSRWRKRNLSSNNDKTIHEKLSFVSCQNQLLKIFPGLSGFAFACDRRNNVRRSPVFPLSHFSKGWKWGKTQQEGRDQLPANHSPGGPKTQYGVPVPPASSGLVLALAAWLGWGPLRMLRQPRAARKAPQGRDCPARGGSGGCEQDGGHRGSPG